MWKIVKAKKISVWRQLLTRKCFRFISDGNGELVGLARQPQISSIYGHANWMIVRDFFSSILRFFVFTARNCRWDNNLQPQRRAQRSALWGERHRHCQHSVSGLQPSPKNGQKQLLKFLLFPCCGPLKRPIGECGSRFCITHCRSMRETPPIHQSMFDRWGELFSISFLSFRTCNPWDSRDLW